MSGHRNRPAAAHVVVRCSGVSEDGSCGREQAIESCGGGIGVRVVSTVDAETANWLASFGWYLRGGRWLCPFCSGNAGQLAGAFYGGEDSP